MSHLPPLPSTPGPFSSSSSTPSLRRQTNLNGGAPNQSKRRPHPLASSFKIPALGNEHPSSPFPDAHTSSLNSSKSNKNDIPSTSSLSSTKTEEIYIPPSTAQLHLSLLSAGILQQHGFSHIQAGALANLTTEVEEYIQEIFRDAKNWAEGCGRRRVGVRDLVEVLEGQGEEMMSELRRGEGSRAIYVDREERKTIPSSPGDKSTKEIDEEIRGSEGDMQGAEIEDDQGIITETQRAVVVPARGYVGLSISGELKRIRKMTRTWTRRRDQERITFSPQPLRVEPIPLSPPRPHMIHLTSDEDDDAPPSAATLSARRKAKANAKGKKPEYAEDVPWVPRLPARHTWKRSVAERRTKDDHNHNHQGKDATPITIKRSITPRKDDSSTSTSVTRGRISDKALDYLFNTSASSQSDTLPADLGIINHQRPSFSSSSSSARGNSNVRSLIYNMDSSPGSGVVVGGIPKVKRKRSHGHHIRAGGGTGGTTKWIVPGLEKKTASVIRLKRTITMGGTGVK